MSGFQKKTIRKVLRNRINQLLASIPDQDDGFEEGHEVGRDNRPMKDRMRASILVTGGSITSMLLGEKINDFDVYFKNYDVAKEVAEYYVNLFNRTRTVPEGGVKYTPVVKEETRPNIKGEDEKRIVIFLKSAGVAGEEQPEYQYFENGPDDNHDEFLDAATDSTSFFGDQGVATVIEDAQEEPSIDLIDAQYVDIKKAKGMYRPVFLTDNAVNLSDKMQLIIRFYGTHEEIHRNFDFVHCTGVYDYAMNALHLSPEMMEACLTKRLIYIGGLYPIASVLRTRKFIERGWKISAGQYLKILQQVSKIDFANVHTLKEQLMGVDVAYMHELIAQLSKVEPNTRVDETYLASLIDRIFED
jgi:hypothetical protein